MGWVMDFLADNWFIIFLVLMILVVVIRSRNSFDVHLSWYQAVWVVIMVAALILLIAATYTGRREPMALSTVIENYFPGALLIMLGYFAARVNVKSGRVMMIVGSLWTMLMAYLMFFH